MVHDAYIGNTHIMGQLYSRMNWWGGSYDTDNPWTNVVGSYVPDHPWTYVVGSYVPDHPWTNVVGSYVPDHPWTNEGGHMIQIILEKIDVLCRNNFSDGRFYVYKWVSLASWKFYTHKNLRWTKARFSNCRNKNMLNFAMKLASNATLNKKLHLLRLTQATVNLSPEA